MKITRRDLGATGALTLAMSTLLRSTPSFAGPDETAVGDAVEAMRRALLAADKAQLEKLAADRMSYGHSSGRVETKAEFITAVMNRKATVKSLEFPELKVAVVGNAAIARHIYAAESETDGKPNSVRIGALEVWQKDGGWKLLARQGFKLA